MICPVSGSYPHTPARQQAHLVKQHATGEHSIADLAELFSVSRATVYRVLDRASTIHHPTRDTTEPAPTVEE
ncbi:Resolvase helix-turn-helix domain protein [Actinobacteria bacterium OV450]|nr:Resolvase helix-turn-helix domain protein [Actinobacteria bacterium OV450]